MAETRSLLELSDEQLRDAAVSINRAVHDKSVAALLEQRHFLGVARRHHGDVDDSVQSLQAAKEAQTQGKLGAYAIFDFNGRAIGMTTVMPSLTLCRQKRSLPPVMARLFRNTHEIPTNGPNVASWTTEVGASGWLRVNAIKQSLSFVLFSGEAERVYKAYHEANGLPQPEGLVVSWAIEPADAPRWVHNAIRDAGMAPQANGIYDIQESRRHAPPVSTLYTFARL